MLNPRPYIMKNKIQHYAWGMCGRKAFIPKLLNIESESNLPFAELWMGAHPKAPSVVMANSNEIPLDKLIEEFPIETLGQELIQKFNNKLPLVLEVKLITPILGLYLFTTIIVSLYWVT